MKIPKQCQVFLAFLFFSLFTFNPNADAQNPPLPEVMKICGLDVGPGAPAACNGDFWAQMDENCTGGIQPHIFMVNLDNYHINREIYGLPSELPEIWVRHESSPGNWILSGPYDQAHYIGERAFANDGLSGSVYGIPLDLAIEAVENQCQGVLGPETYTANRTLEIVTLISTDPVEYIPYPVEQFAEPHEVWSCDAFYDTWCLCNPNSSITNPLTNEEYDCATYKVNPVYDLSICFNCGEECFDFLDGTDERNGSLEKTEALNDTPAIELQINPNPFREEINISVWIPQTGDVTYTLYDARGKVILRQTELMAKGSLTKSISAEHLSTGVYYFHYQQGEQQSIQKVIKH